VIQWGQPVEVEFAWNAARLHGDHVPRFASVSLNTDHTRATHAIRNALGSVPSLSRYGGSDVTPGGVVDGHVMLAGKV
jgi:hypothetical protein